MNYKEYLKTEDGKRQQKQMECSHPTWSKICSCCGKVICSEKLDELEEERSEEIIINNQ